MEARNVVITLEKARKWYKSSNSSLKEVALQAFTENELNPFDFTKIKTFEGACEALDLNYEDCLIELNIIEQFSKSSAASFKLNIIRKAINKGQKIDLLEGKVWYPYTPFVTKNNTYIKNKYKEKVGEFIYKNNIYKVFGGDVSYSPYSGFGAFSSNTGVGLSYAVVSFLGCATKEIAQHFSKYFATEIFDAKYGDLIDYKWL